MTIFNFLHKAIMPSKPAYNEPYPLSVMDHQSQRLVTEKALAGCSSLQELIDKVTTLTNTHSVINVHILEYVRDDVAAYLSARGIMSGKMADFRDQLERVALIVDNGKDVEPIKRVALEKLYREFKFCKTVHRALLTALGMNGGPVNLERAHQLLDSAKEAGFLFGNNSPHDGKEIVRLAIESRDPQLFRKVLQLRPNLEGNYGYTGSVAHLASMVSLPMLRAVLEVRPEFIHLRNRFNETLFNTALRDGPREEISRMVDFFIAQNEQSGFDLSTFDRNQSSPLHRLIDRGEMRSDAYNRLLPHVDQGMTNYLDETAREMLERVEFENSNPYHNWV